MFILYKLIEISKSATRNDYLKSALVSSIVAFVFTPFVVLVTVYGSNFLNKANVEIKYVQTYAEEGHYTFDEKTKGLFIRNKSVSEDIMQMAFPLAAKLQEDKASVFFKSNLNNFFKMWASAANGMIFEMIPLVAKKLVPIFDLKIDRLKLEIELVEKNVQKIRVPEARMSADYSNSDLLDISENQFFYLLENDPDRLVRMHNYINKRAKFHVDDLMEIRNRLFDISLKSPKRTGKLYFEVGMINEGNIPASITNNAVIIYGSKKYRLESDGQEYSTIEPHGFLTQTFYINLNKNRELKGKLAKTTNDISYMLTVTDTDNNKFNFTGYRVNIP